MRNALDYLPRKTTRRDLIAWLGKWQAKYPKLCEWVEGNIEETFTFYRLPKEHHKHLKSTNMLERLNQELKRRTHVIRILNPFAELTPNAWAARI